jgi:hypothetical protein
MSNGKITGELLYELDKEASIESDYAMFGVAPQRMPWKEALEETQDQFNRTAKKLNDFLIYGRKPE